VKAAQSSRRTRYRFRIRGLYSVWICRLRRWPRRWPQESTRGFESHAPLWARKLSQTLLDSGVTPVLRNKYLGAENDTDVLQIEIQTMLTPYHSRDIGDRIAHTLGHALAHFRRGYRGSRCSGDLIKFRTRRGRPVVFYLFDSAPGGSGHIASLLEQQDLWSGRHWSCLKAMQYIRNAAARPVWPVFLIRKARMTSSRGSWTARSHLSSLGARSASEPLAKRATLPVEWRLNVLRSAAH